MIQGNDQLMGTEFPLVDDCALVFDGWGWRSGFPMKKLSAYGARHRPPLQIGSIIIPVPSDIIFPSPGNVSEYKHSSYV